MLTARLPYKSIKFVHVLQSFTCISISWVILFHVLFIYHCVKIAWCMLRIREDIFFSILKWFPLTCKGWPYDAWCNQQYGCHRKWCRCFINFCSQEVVSLIRSICGLLCLWNKLYFNVHFNSVFKFDSTFWLPHNLDLNTLLLYT